MKRITLGAVFAAIVTFTGCTCSGPKTPSGSSAEQKPTAKILHLAIWSNYINDDLLKKFENESGYQVSVSNYSSNEELLSKLQAGATGYDVIVPSDYMVRVMSQLNLLQPLDTKKIPYSAGIDPAYLKREFDPENQVSLPYAWSVAGIAVNTKFYNKPLSGWHNVFEDTALAGHISMLDDMRETIGVALKTSDQSLNTQDVSELKQAKVFLTKIRPQIKAFTSEPIDQLTAGDFWVSHMYSSDALQANAATQGTIQFILPTEGGSWSIDNLAIPKGATDTEGAHAFINFLLKPEVYASIVATRMFGPVVKDIKSFLPSGLQTNPVLFPSNPSALAHFEMMQDLGESTGMYEQIWTEVKAASH